MIYIASPYTDRNPEVMRKRYEQVKHVTAEYVKSGVVAYSPIVHGHALAVDHDMPSDFEFWKHQCLSMLRHATAMVVVKLDGWEKSVGVTHEISVCEDLGIPVSFIDYKV